MRRFEGGVGIAAGSVTTKLCPAMVSVAVRVSAVGLNAAANVTVPDPLPVPPLLIVIHDAVFVADQVQPVKVVTVTVTLPPPPAIVWPAGDSANVQGDAACVTVKVAPAMVNVPVRDDVVGFAVTL